MENCLGTIYIKEGLAIKTLHCQGITPWTLGNGGQNHSTSCSVKIARPFRA